MREGYAICFNEWALDSSIKNELGLLLIISSLTAEKGYCYANNKYLSELLKVPETSISRKIKKLEKRGYIKIDYKKRGWEIEKREIRLAKMTIDHYQKRQQTIIKNAKYNNTIIKNINKNKRKYTNEDIENWYVTQEDA